MFMLQIKGAKYRAGDNTTRVDYYQANPYINFEALIPGNLENAPEDKLLEEGEKFLSKFFDHTKYVTQLEAKVLELDEKLKEVNELNEKAKERFDALEKMFLKSVEDSKVEEELPELDGLDDGGLDLGSLDLSGLEGEL